MGAGSPLIMVKKLSQCRFKILRIVQAASVSVYILYLMLYIHIPYIYARPPKRVSSIFAARSSGWFERDSQWKAPRFNMYSSEISTLRGTGSVTLSTMYAKWLLVPGTVVPGSTTRQYYSIILYLSNHREHFRGRGLVTKC